MGKGKGSLAFWASTVSQGHPLLELSGLRSGRALRYANQLSIRIPGGVALLFANTRGGSGAKNPNQTQLRNSRLRGLDYSRTLMKFSRNARRSRTVSYLKSKPYKSAVPLRN